MGLGDVYKRQMATAAAGIGSTSAIAARRRHDKLKAVRDIPIPEHRKTPCGGDVPLAVCV